jgi:predicted anti-sigma-YlaC factor YlaD
MGRMSSTCDSLERLSLGAYVLGALDPVERAEVEAHLAGCAACRDELSELAGLPGLLSRMRVEDVLEPLPSPPPGMVERLIARQRAARRAWRRRVAVVATAGAVAAAGVIAGVVAIDTGGSGSAPQVASVSATNHRTGVTAAMGLRPTEWGTAVEVRLRGVQPGTRCRLIAGSRTGRREVAGTWRADYDGTANVETATGIAKNQLESLEIVTAGGRRLVRASVE